MNYKTLINKALEANIEAMEVTYNATNKTSCTIFNHEIESYEISNQSSINARGIFNGKLGLASTEKLDNKSCQYIIDSIKNSASYNEKEEEPIIFKGSKKYTKKNTFNKELAEIDVNEKIKNLRLLEEAAYKESSLVTDVEVSYEEVTNEKVLANSYGLTLKEKTNYYLYAVEVVCKKGDEIKTDFDIFLESDYSKFDYEKLAKEVVEKAVSKFDGISIKAKTYKCVMAPEVTSNLLRAMVNAGFDAEAVQKQSSILAGKLNQQVFSNRVTILEKPLEKNCFFTYFDYEGVATYNKTLVDKGVIKTYLYNLETAKKDNVESTGNGYGENKIGTSTVNLTLKAGKKSEEDIIAQAKNGIYVTSVTGLHSGLNAQSGDFSLEAEGYLIKDGKKDQPLKLLTIGGNIYTLFNEVVAIANNEKRGPSSVSCPSILVKKLKVSSL